MRSGKFRNSFEFPEPFVPGEVTTVEFTMPDIFHTFRKGHRLMIHVQSSWFPLVDRNPQTFTNIVRTLVYSLLVGNRLRFCTGPEGSSFIMNYGSRPCTCMILYVRASVVLA